MNRVHCVSLGLLILFNVIAVRPSFSDDRRDSATSPWDVATLRQAPKATFGAAKGLVQSVYYEGETFQGKPTRVFAYYARPSEGDGPFPAVLLVHGGKGKAFPEWAKQWAKRGYVALAMDLSGNGPSGRLPDGGPPFEDEWIFRDFDAATVKDTWCYHAVAAVLRGHGLLASRPEVDKQNIGMTGISWGGFLTCIVAGIDHQIKAAVPVYGCGFLSDDSVWVDEGWFPRMTPQQRERWNAQFDPSAYLGRVKCPMLFVNGTNDFAFPLDSYQKSYSLVKSPLTLNIENHREHGHIWTYREVDAFLDSQLRGSEPLANLSAASMADGKLTAKCSCKSPIAKAELVYTTDIGNWQTRRWSTVAAEVRGENVSAQLPSERPLTCFLNVTDERGLTVSTPHVTLDAQKGQQKTAD